MTFIPRPVRYLLTLSLLIQTVNADDAAAARKLIDKAIQSYGGRKAIQKTRMSIVEDKGVYFGMGDAMPYTGRYVFVMGNPGRYRMEIRDVFVQVIDRDNAWINAAGQTIELDTQQLEILKANMLVSYATSLIPFLEENDDFALGTAKPETVDGKSCQGITIDHEGMPTVTVFFHPENGLITKTRFKQKVPELGFAEATEETIYHSYREHDGVKSAAKMTMFRDGKKFIEMEPKSYSYPSKIDDSEFAKP